MVAGRDLRNSFTQKFSEMREGNVPMEEILQFMKDHTMYDALVQGDIEEGELPCSQNAGIITELISAGDVVRNVVAELASVMAVLESKVKAV